MNVTFSNFYKSYFGFGRNWFNITFKLQFRVLLILIKTKASFSRKLSIIRNLLKYIIYYIICNTFLVKIYECYIKDNVGGSNEKK